MPLFSDPRTHESQRSSRRLLLILLFLLALLSLGGYGFFVGLTTWFFYFLLSWVVMLAFTTWAWMRMSMGCFVFALSIALMGSGLFSFLPRSSSTRSVSPPSNSQTSRAGTTTSCTDLAQTYDGKILRITSPQGLTGTVALRIDHATCAYTITWHELFHSSAMAANQPQSQSAVTDYAYTADVVFAREGAHPLDGRVDPVYANDTQLPPDAFSLGFRFDFYASPDIVSGVTKHKTTTAFHHNFQQSGTFSQVTLDDILAVKEIRIYANPTNSDESALQGKPVVVIPILISLP